MQNRRNLYRLLHVQRDAPAAIIKGSYRTLMQTLRKHPDLGGDEWDAQLLNEARRILCDPQARARYDATLADESTDRAPPADGAGHGRGHGDDPSDSHPATANDGPRPGGDEPPRDGDPHCHYCGAPVAPPSVCRVAYACAGRCRRCDAPTRAAQPAAQPGAQPAMDRIGGSERRGLHRVADGAGITVVRHWPDNVTSDATLLEFSVSGCALVSGTDLVTGDTVLLRAPLFIATGTVRSSLPVDRGTRHRIGILFVGLEMHARPGAVFSTSV